VKQKIGPAAIIVGIVVVAAIVFGIYKATLGTSKGPEPTAPNAPSYVKQMQQHQGKPTGYGQAYAQGAQQSQNAGGGHP
jgi:hypothetical protein